MTRATVTVATCERRGGRALPWAARAFSIGAVGKVCVYWRWLFNTSTLCVMTTHEILTAIDEEISRLQQAKLLLSGDGSNRRPSHATSFAFGANTAVHKRKPLSKAARAKIAAAQRKRWAAQKAAVKKTTSAK